MNLVQDATGRLEKEALLKREKDTRFLKWAVDDSITFGVTVDTVELVEDYKAEDNSVPKAEPVKWWDEFDALCLVLSLREITGHEARDAINSLMLTAPTEVDVLWACRVLNKDLRCGVNRSTQPDAQKRIAPGLMSDVCRLPLTSL